MLAIVHDEFLDSADLYSLKSAAMLKPDGVKPELGFFTGPLYMDMCWLVAFVSVEKETVRPEPNTVGMMWILSSRPAGGRVPGGTRPAPCERASRARPEVINSGDHHRA